MHSQDGFNGRTHLRDVPRHVQRIVLRRQQRRRLDAVEPQLFDAVNALGHGLLAAAERRKLPGLRRLAHHLQRLALGARRPGEHTPPLAAAAATARCPRRRWLRAIAAPAAAEAAAALPGGQRAAASCTGAPAA
eukprot:365625-Chlamydomonas_euryale.AAC.10